MTSTNSSTNSSFNGIAPASAVFNPTGVFDIAAIESAAIVETIDVLIAATDAYCLAVRIDANGAHGLIRSTIGDELEALQPKWDAAANGVYHAMREGPEWDALRDGIDTVSAFILGTRALITLRRFDEAVEAAQRFVAFGRSGMVR